MKKLLCLFAVACILGWALPAHATLWNMETTLGMDGLQENPPNASPATGYGYAVLDDVAGTLSISGTYSGLTSGETAAHVHGYNPPGPPNAGVLFGITFGGGTFSGSGPVNAANTLAGLTYVNIHTTNFPLGEIRGQILIPEPSTIVLAATGLIAAVALRRRIRRAAG